MLLKFGNKLDILGLRPWRTCGAPHLSLSLRWLKWGEMFWFHKSCKTLDVLQLIWINGRISRALQDLWNQLRSNEWKSVIGDDMLGSYKLCKEIDPKSKSFTRLRPQVKTTWAAEFQCGDLNKGIGEDMSEYRSLNIAVLFETLNDSDSSGSLWPGLVANRCGVWRETLEGNIGTDRRSASHAPASDGSLLRGRSMDGLRFSNAQENTILRAEV